MKFIPVCGSFSADTVYCDDVLVARDVSVTLPEVAATTFDIQAMGNMSLPDWSRLENMETAITKIGVDKGLSRMAKPGVKHLEFRGVQLVTEANGTTRKASVKAFITGQSTKIPGIGVSVGSASENEITYTTSRFQLFVDGEEMWCIDRLAGVCRIDGEEYADADAYL